MLKLILLIKMKVAVCFICFIAVCSFVPKTDSQDSPPPSPKVPGCSACLYYGSIKEACNLTTVPVSSLPKECTSLLFVDIKVNAEFNVADGSGVSGNEEYLQCIVDSGMPSFVYYGHPSFRDWTNALTCNVENDGVNAKAEMKNLKAYLDKYPNLSGIILEWLSLDLEEPTNFPNLTANFQVYLDEMRSTFPDLGIGLELVGRKVITYYDSDRSLEWLDFTVLDPSIDFYILDLNTFNACTDEFKVGGTVPIDGDSSLTIQKLVNYVTEAGIPKDKTYFGYRTGPVATSPDASECVNINSKLCASPNLDFWCSDNTLSYFDKGKFAKDNGVGFVAYQVDMDDPDGCCQCGLSYPAFYDLLAGFNGDTTPAPCPLMDKN